MIYTVSSLWNKWNILLTVVKLIWDAIVEDYHFILRTTHPLYICTQETVKDMAYTCSIQN